MLLSVDTCTLNSRYNPRVGDEGLVEPGRREPVGQVREAAALVLLLKAVDPLLRLRRRVVVDDGLVEADRQPLSHLRRLLPDGTRLGVCVARTCVLISYHTHAYTQARTL